MRERRYYRKGQAYGRLFFPAERSFTSLLKAAKEKGYTEQQVEQLDNAEYGIKLDSFEEMRGWWRNSFFLVMQNTRWVLDNLDALAEYQVNWNYYGKKKGRKQKILVGMPPRDLVIEKAFFGNEELINKRSLKYKGLR